MMMERFIEAIKAQPCLWNPLRGDYREGLARDLAWQNVVERAKMPHIKNVQTAKQEWKKLRDNHRDALRRAKLGKNKLLPAYITTWKYAKSMQFLEPHMKYRVTEHIEHDASHITSDPNDMENNSLYFLQNTEESNHGSCEYDVSTSDNRRKRKYDGGETTNTEHKSAKYDSLQAFVNFMSESIKAMPPWMQTQVKKKIFNVIVQAEEELTTTGVDVDVLINESEHSINPPSCENDYSDSDNVYNIKIKSEVHEDPELIS